MTNTLIWSWATLDIEHPLLSISRVLTYETVIQHLGAILSCYIMLMCCTAIAEGQ
jgi:hypothetical protein